jgi:regulator of protease activity HflC (stomatin/prohibitin superfamily)
MRYGSIIAFVVAIIFIALAVTVVVPPGHVGVQILFGSVYDKEFVSGLHLKNPMSEVRLISVRSAVYTMSIVPEEGQTYGDDSIDVLSNEGMTLKMDISVQYRIIAEEASWILKNKVYNTEAQFESDYIRPEIRTAIRNIAADHTAAEMYSPARKMVGVEIEKEADVMLQKNGVRCDTVNLRNVSLPKMVSDAIDRKKEAEQESQRMEYILEKETKEADRKRIEAKGIRDFQLTVAESLTPNLIKWKSLEVAEHIGTSENAKVVFFGGDNIPFILGGM